MTHSVTAANAIPSAAQQLLAEATQLASDMQQVLSELLSLAPEVATILSSAITTSSSSRAKLVLQQTIDKHNEVIRFGRTLPDGSNDIIQRYRDAKLDAVLREVSLRLAKVDPQKLENEELLIQCNRARETILNAPDVWAVCISAVNISLYSLPFYHLSVLRAFLNRPSAVNKAFSSAASIFKALVKDLGGEVVPFIGVLETIFELTTPLLERDVERMRQGIQVLDRLFRLDDSLSNILVHAYFVESTIRLADDSTKSYSAHFERDAAWLIGVLAGAERT